MTDMPRAADLPDNSVVADNFTAYIKTHPTHWAQWRGTDGAHLTNYQVDEAISDGAQVLRVGTGAEVDCG